MAKAKKMKTVEQPKQQVDDYSLTGAEDHYIRSNMNDASPGTIAAFLRKDNPEITETIVRTHIHRIKDTNAKSRTQKLMQQKNGMTILTQAASERGDTVKDKMHEKKKQQPHIFKIDRSKP